MRRVLAAVGWALAYVLGALVLVYLAQRYGVRSFIPFRLEGV